MNGAKFTTQTWIGWISAMVVATALLIRAAYSEFETKDHAKEVWQDAKERLVRIEDKLDKGR